MPAAILFTTIVGFGLLLGVQIFYLFDDMKTYRTPAAEGWRSFKLPPLSSNIGGAAAQCDYCKRFGALGVCAGCGAPNKPAEGRRLLDISTHSQPGQFLVLPEGVKANRVPAFPMVKR